MVLIRYGKKTRGFMPTHNRLGTVVIPGRGRPRNHGIEVDGVIYVIPAGNLQPVPAGGPRQGDLFNAR